MKAKLIIDGKEIEIEISEKFALELTKAFPVEKKKTGYERVECGEFYFLLTNNGKGVHISKEGGNSYDDSLYATANYYSDKTIAENNARADELYRQLRRFAVEHRETEIDWNNGKRPKWFINYDHIPKKIHICSLMTLHSFGEIYYDSKEAAQLAIDTFKDELMWYFTEYKGSLQ